MIVRRNSKRCQRATPPPPRTITKATRVLRARVLLTRVLRTRVLPTRAPHHVIRAPRTRVVVTTTDIKALPPPPRKVKAVQTRAAKGITAEAAIAPTRRESRIEIGKRTFSG